MMIKNNIWNILLVVFAFFGAYFSLGYIDSRDNLIEEINEEKYQDILVEGKSANLDEVQILSGTELDTSIIFTPEIEEDINLVGEFEGDTIVGEVGEELIESEGNEGDLLNSEGEVILSEEGEITTELTENTPKNTIKENLLGVFRGAQTPTENKEEELKAKNKTFPESLNTSLNFHSQSPLGTWGEIFGETCEEASVLLAYLYFKGISVTDLEFRDELLRLVDYQNEVFGDFKHTTVFQTAEILRDYYKYTNYHILENPSADDIKYNIAKGSIVLAPFYGVGMNPYYSGIGPENHFMVLKGYTKDTFISHDVGTRRGENYEYPIETIMDRMHDYDSESVLLGGKRVIIVSPE